MNATATIAEIAKNQIAILNYDGYALQVDYPNGWDDVKKLTTKVLLYDGKQFVWSGWNSDRNVSFFKVDNRKFATIL